MQALIIDAILNTSFCIPADDEHRRLLKVIRDHQSGVARGGTGAGARESTLILKAQVGRLQQLLSNRTNPNPNPNLDQVARIFDKEFVPLSQLPKGYAPASAMTGADADG